MASCEREDDTPRLTSASACSAAPRAPRAAFSASLWSISSARARNHSARHSSALNAVRSTTNPDQTRVSVWQVVCYLPVATADSLGGRSPHRAPRAAKRKDTPRRQPDTAADRHQLCPPVGDGCLNDRTQVVWPPRLGEERSELAPHVGLSEAVASWRGVQLVLFFLGIHGVHEASWRSCSTGMAHAAWERGDECTITPPYHGTSHAYKTLTFSSATPWLSWYARSMSFLVVSRYVSLYMAPRLDIARCVVCQQLPRGGASGVSGFSTVRLP